MATSNSPFIAWHNSFAIESPKPLPSFVRDLSPRTNLSVNSSAEISSGEAEMFFISNTPYSDSLETET